MGCSPEYSIWAAMKQRCRNPNDAAYFNYGARGIDFCDEWMSFVNFYNDMGCRPTKKHSLDRSDNNKGYSKSNCEWTTRDKQNSNKRSNILLTAYGTTLNISQWARVLEIPHQRIRNRLSHPDMRWTDPYKILFTPKK